MRVPIREFSPVQLQHQPAHISATEESIDPAGAALSSSTKSIGLSGPPIFECGHATSAPGGKCALLSVVVFIPSGFRIFSVTYSSHDFPVTAGIICPAAMYSKLS